MELIVWPGSGSNWTKCWFCYSRFSRMNLLIYSSQPRYKSLFILGLYLNKAELNCTGWDLAELKLNPGV